MPLRDEGGRFISAEDAEDRYRAAIDRMERWADSDSARAPEYYARAEAQFAYYADLLGIGQDEEELEDEEEEEAPEEFDYEEPPDYGDGGYDEPDDYYYEEWEFAL